MSGEKELMKYTVKDWSIRKTPMGIEVALVLGRKILNEILTTYLPTCLLVVIVHSTNYYKDFFFEAVVTVNLTGTFLFLTSKNSSFS
jgi:hypothetical protein